MLEKDNIYNLRNRNVKRMLWPVDHEQLRIDIRNEQLRIKKEFTQKYNFDFETEQPLCGRYDWELVESESPISSPNLISPSIASSSTTTQTQSDGPSSSFGIRTTVTIKDKKSNKNDVQNNKLTEKQKNSRKVIKTHSSRTSRYYESCTTSKRSLRVRRKTSRSGR